MEDLAYIKKFSRITINSLCDKLGVSSSNFWSGKCSSKTYKKAKKLLQAELGQLLIDDYMEEAQNESK